MGPESNFELPIQCSMCQFTGFLELASDKSTQTGFKGGIKPNWQLQKSFLHSTPVGASILPKGRTCYFFFFFFFSLRKARNPIPFYATVCVWWRVNKSMIEALSHVHNSLPHHKLHPGGYVLACTKYMFDFFSTLVWTHLVRNKSGPTSCSYSLNQLLCNHTYWRVLDWH